MAGSAARQAGRARSCSYHEPNASTQCSAARWTARLVLRRLGMGITPWGGGGQLRKQRGSRQGNAINRLQLPL